MSPFCAFVYEQGLSNVDVVVVFNISNRLTEQSCLCRLIFTFFSSAVIEASALPIRKLCVPPHKQGDKSRFSHQVAKSEPNKQSSQQFIYSFAAIIQIQSPNRNPLKATYARVLRILFIISDQREVVSPAKLCQSHMKVNFAAGKHRKFHGFAATVHTV